MRTCNTSDQCANASVLTLGLCLDDCTQNFATHLPEELQRSQQYLAQAQHQLQGLAGGAAPAQGAGSIEMQAQGAHQGQEAGVQGHSPEPRHAGRQESQNDAQAGGLSRRKAAPAGTAKEDAY